MTTSSLEMSQGRLDDVDIMCRVCLARNLELYHLFDEPHKIDNLTLAQVLTEITTRKIYRFDYLPHGICRDCMENARNAFAFKRQVEQSFRQLLAVIPEADNFQKQQQEKQQIAKTTSTTTTEQAVQTDQSPLYVCKLCDNTFYEKLKLREHLINAHCTNNRCVICQMTFENQRQLQSHLSRRHSYATISIECPICKHCFGKRDHMLRHLRTVHKVTTSGTSNTLEETEIDLIDVAVDPDDVLTKCNISEALAPYEHGVDQCVKVRVLAVNPIDNSDDEKPYEGDGPPLNIDNESNYSSFDYMEADNKTDDEDVKEDRKDLITLMDIDNESNKMSNATNDCITETQLNADTTVQTTSTATEADVKMNITCEDFSMEKKEKQKNVKKKSSEVPPDDNCCHECQRTFSRRCHLLRHMRTHLDQKPYACAHCPKRFARSDHLKKHEQTVHSKNKLKCTECAWESANVEAMERHNALRHGNGEVTAHKIHPCEFCDKTFVCKSSLRKHAQTHTNAEICQYECKYCDRKFTQRSEFREHEKSHDRKYLCSICGESFTRNDYLTVHMRRHNGEKPYKCRYCDKCFPRATDRNIHERYHTGVKPNLCTLCGKAFHRAYNLTIHMRTHNGEKPYKCDHCEKSFSQSNDLKTHIRRHTGERYKCSNCDATFLQLYGLRHHALAAHGVSIESTTGRLQKFATAPIPPEVQADLIHPPVESDDPCHSIEEVKPNVATSIAEKS